MPMEDVYLENSDGSSLKEMLTPCNSEDDCIEVKNQFSYLKIFKDVSGNGPRLKIILMSSGEIKYVDPFTLEILLRIPDSIVKNFVVEP